MMASAPSRQLRESEPPGASISRQFAGESSRLYGGSTNRSAPTIFSPSSRSMVAIRPRRRSTGRSSFFRIVPWSVSGFGLRARSQGERPCAISEATRSFAHFSMGKEYQARRQLHGASPLCLVPLATRNLRSGSGLRCVGRGRNARRRGGRFYLRLYHSRPRYLSAASLPVSAFCLKRHPSSCCEVESPARSPQASPRNRAFTCPASPSSRACLASSTFH